MLGTLLSRSIHHIAHDAEKEAHAMRFPDFELRPGAVKELLQFLVSVGASQKMIDERSKLGSLGRRDEQNCFPYLVFRVGPRD